MRNFVSRGGLSRCVMSRLVVFRPVAIGVAMLMVAPIGAAAGEDRRVGVTAVAPPLNHCVSDDNGDPVVTAVTLSPTTADVRRHSQRVKVRVRAHDTGGPGAPSGIRQVAVDLRTPVLRINRVPLARSAPGLWSGTFTIPRGVPHGAWRVSTVLLVDMVGNYNALTRGELSLESSDARVGPVRSIPDTRPPTLGGFAISTTAVDARRHDTNLTFTARARDSQSRVRSVTVYFEAFGRLPLSKVPGSPHTYRRTITIRRFSDAGGFDVYLDLEDNVSNVRSVSPQMLKSRGFPHRVHIRARTDDRAPVLVTASTTPSSVDVTTAAAKITMTVHARDAQSGVKLMRARLRRGHHHGGGQFDLVSGTIHDGIWKAVLIIRPCNGNQGGWQRAIYSYDGAQNSVFQSLPTVDVTSSDHNPPVFKVPGLIDAADPIVMTSNEAVVGITTQSVPLFKNRHGSPGGPAVAGTWSCVDRADADTDCATGTVRVATFTPASPLVPSSDYWLVVNPEHTLDVVDLAGNPVYRDLFVLSTP